MQLKEFFDKPHLLPNIPEIVQDLIATFNDPDPDMNRIVTDLSQDPVLSAKVLRLANSSRFGGVREIASVKEASIRLGLERLRTLVIASGLISATDSIPGLDLQAFWKKSFQTAEVCRQLAVSAGLPAEQEFTCGMLHDLGLLLLVVVDPKEADDIMALSARQGRLQAEKSVLGFTSAEIGAELARRWHFPEPVVTGLREQFSPMQHTKLSPEAGLIFLSTWLLERHELPKDPPPSWPQPLASKLGLEWAALVTAKEAVERNGSPFMAAV
ncbi:HDOD domain-containing protein [Gallaecimonas mangrovi]|uniref:HDOD domain-containing protein n=1 Tax=Gallaecimonas mangrovi TaxID=2291597 RepID=UPI000E20A0FA|nr:HDOD domain-containing protein [Gallaecimonas mangrovi]